MSDIIGLVGLPVAIRSIGGPGVATPGGEVYTLQADGNPRNILDDGQGNMQAHGYIQAGVGGALISSTGAIITAPPAPTSGIVVASGTAWQNTLGCDVIVRIPVTYNPTAAAAATLAVGVGSANNPAQVTEESVPAGVTAGAVHTTVVYAAANYHVLLTATNATIGAATAYPV